MKKVLLLTLHSQNNNFGSVLQASSLYNYLEKKGFETTILNYQPYYSNGALSPKLFVKKIIVNTMFLPNFIRRTKNFNKILKNEKLTKKYTKIEELQGVEKDYDIVMIGSDQVWNPTYLCGQDSAYYLDFVKEKKKVSYAASVGTQDLSKEQLEDLRNKIQEFSNVSVREEISAEQLKSVGREDATYVLDPVFLFDKSYYSKLQEKTNREGYVLAYIIHKDPLISEIVDEAAKRLNKKVIQVGGFASKCNYDEFMRDIGPCEFLDLIDNADFIVTNSFHGLAFSHIYHKQFAAVMPHGNELRLKNIIETAGTEDHVIKCVEDFEKCLIPIDYEKVDERINAMREQSYKYLDKVLNVSEEE